jgi:hypothetical protein
VVDEADCQTGVIFGSGSVSGIPTNQLAELLD